MQDRQLRAGILAGQLLPLLLLRRRESGRHRPGEETEVLEEARRRQHGLLPRPHDHLLRYEWVLAPQLQKSWLLPFALFPFGTNFTPIKSPGDSVCSKSLSIIKSSLNVHNILGLLICMFQPCPSSYPGLWTTAPSTHLCSILLGGCCSSPSVTLNS